jgi:hypothetical protein
MTTKAKLDFIFKVLEDTETSITKFSELTEISRATIHHWKRGGNCSDMIRLNIAHKAAQTLEAKP